MSTATATTSDLVRVDDVVVDPDINPRGGGVQQETVDRYVDAIAGGDELPPIILERGTGLLLDGHHRLAARVQLGLADIEYEEHDVPAGWTAKLYAAHLQGKNGLPLPEQDQKTLAREMYEEGRDGTMVAKALNRPRRTVDGWVADLAEGRRAAEEHQRDVRRCLALLLVGVGWTQQQVAATMGLSKQAVSQSVNGKPASDGLSESILRSAVSSAPLDVVDQVAALADRWREDRIFATWSQAQRDLLAQLRAGETVVVNMRAEAHGPLWTWAEQAGLAVRIDRKSQWGNPFLLPDDGTRDVVCDRYADTYYPHKPSLHSQVGSLVGRALGCWCAPARCHGDFLAEQASR